MSVFKIRNYLKYYRERKAVSQESLALSTGIHKLTISRIERNKTRLPYPRTREKIAMALNISVHQVFPPVKFK